MQKAFRQRVMTDPALPVGFAGLFPEVVPVGAVEEGAPSAVYTVTSGEPIPCQAGRIHRDTVEVIVWSPDKAEAVAIAALITARLDRWAGTLSGETIDGVSVSGAPDDGFDEENQEYARLVRFQVIYRI
jgi:hypothetical protein